MTTMYLDFPLTDGSRICVQRHADLRTLPYIRPDGRIPEHAHEYYEMVLLQNRKPLSRGNGYITICGLESS